MYKQEKSKGNKQKFKIVRNSTTLDTGESSHLGQIVLQILMSSTI